MSGSFTSAIPFILVGLVLLVLVVWLLMRMGQSTDVVGDDNAKKDVLEDGAAPAQRNQALIDAAPAAQKQSAPPAIEDTPAPLASAEPAPAPAPTPAPVPPLSTEPTPAPAPAAVDDTPAPLPTPAASPPATADAPDDLRQIKGVGPKLVSLLAEEGITTFAQVAAWTESDIAAIDAKLGRFKGRIERDQWVEQAKLLISGDKEAYADKFGNNG